MSDGSPPQRFDRFVGWSDDMLRSLCVSRQREQRGTMSEAFPKKVPEELLKGTTRLDHDYPGDVCPLHQAPPDSHWFSMRQSEASVRRQGVASVIRPSPRP